MQFHKIQNTQQTCLSQFTIAIHELVPKHRFNEIDGMTGT